MRTSRYAGLSLVECMLGTAIGLGLILSANMVFQTQRQSWLLMQTLQTLHHNASAAFDTLQVSVQLAGAKALQAAGDNRVRMLSLPDNDWGLQEGKTRSDSLAVGHFRALDAMDCQGNKVDKPTYIRDSYQLNHKLELTCKDTQMTGSTYQAIAEGVEDFQVRYALRISTDASASASSWEWKMANHVQNSQDVMAIEICLRMVSAQPINAPLSSSLGCQGEALPQDGKLRRVFRRVIAIRSHVTLDPT